MNCPCGNWDVAALACRSYPAAVSNPIAVSNPAAVSYLAAVLSPAAQSPPPYINLYTVHLGCRGERSAG